MNVIVNSSPGAMPAVIILRPKLDEADINAAVFLDKGEDSVMLAAVSQFDVLNPGSAQARAEIESSNERLLDSDQLLFLYDKELKGTVRSRTVVAAKANIKNPVVLVIEALGMALLGIFGLYLGNQVGAAYVVKSGADLFATDPVGAMIFMGVTLLAGGALKIYEHRLLTDVSRALYARILFFTGIGSCFLWIIMMALSFAPDLGVGATWLADGNDTAQHVYGVVLVVTHLTSDLASGYIVFSGAEHMLLAGYERVNVPNPHYAELVALKAQAVAESEAIRDRKAKAEQFIESFEAGRAEAQQVARFLYQRAALRHAHGRDAAVANAKSTFLN